MHLQPMMLLLTWKLVMHLQTPLWLFILSSNFDFVKLVTIMFRNGSIIESSQALVVTWQRGIVAAS